MGKALITRRGGGKPEGLYAWKKYTYEIAEKRDSAQSVNITRTRTSGGSMKVYCSDSYTYDSDTGLYSLVNPTTVTAYCGSSGWNGLRGKYVIQTLNRLNGGTTTSGEVLLLISSDASFSETNAGSFSSTDATQMYGLTVSACTMIYYGEKLDFLGYLVDKNPLKYPDGAVHTDGYYYEKVVDGIPPEMFGCTKMAIDTVTFASDQDFMLGGVKYYLPHSLGEIPKHAILWAQTDITTYVYPGYLQGFDIRKNVGLNAYVCVNWLIGSNNSFTGELRGASLTADSVYINGGTFKAGVEYKLITMV